MQENYSLKWQHFHQNIATAFKDLRTDDEFLDVTIACGEEQQIQAHKVIISVAGLTCPAGNSFTIAVYRDWRQCSTLLTGATSEKMFLAIYSKSTRLSIRLLLLGSTITNPFYPT